MVIMIEILINAKKLPVQPFTDEKVQSQLSAFKKFKV